MKRPGFNMIKQKRTVRIIGITLLLSMLLTIGMTASAHAYTNANSNGNSTVYVRPNASSMVIGSIGTESVKVFWQENGFYYIEYTVDSGAYGGYKRGYVPTSKITVSGIASNPYPPWSTKTKSNYTVYNRPATNSYAVGTVFSTDETIVLAEEGAFYYIQYPVSGGYKRGYISKTYVNVTPQTYGINNNMVYYIRNVNSGKFLDVYNNGTANGTKAIQYAFNGNLNQQWKLEFLSGEGLYKLHPMHAPNMSLDVLSGYMSDGSGIGIYGGDYSSSRWNIADIGSGKYKLMSHCSERTKAAVVQNASMSNGAEIVQWRYNAGENDQWMFVPLDAFLTHGWPKSGDVTNIPINPYFYSSTWQTAMDNALSSWNNSSARITFTKTTSENTITAGTLDDNFFGINKRTFSGSSIIKFEITLKSDLIIATATNLPNFIRSVLVHELGHSIWLADKPSTPLPSIMKHDRDRNTLVSPTAFDISNVNTKY